MIHHPILAIVGPTAAGKTELAMALAAKCPVEIVVADSQQVYRGFDVGTSKPTPAMRAAVPHHGCDLADPQEQCSVGRWIGEIGPAIAAIQRRGRTPLIVAGTGLYVRALRRGLWNSPPPDPNIRTRLTREAERGGAGSLHDRLRLVDPASAARIDARNIQRVMRALEVFEQTGRPLTQWFEETQSSVEGPWHVVGVTRARSVLHQRIAERVEAMVEAGWIEEVRGLLAAGWEPHLPAFEAIGYRLIASHIREGVPDRSSLVQRVIEATRQYAKRQETWFRKETVDQWYDASRERVETLADDVVKQMQESMTQGSVSMGGKNPKSKIQHPQSRDRAASDF